MSNSQQTNPWDLPEQHDELFKQQKELFKMRQEVFKSQQELFEAQCQKIARLTDNIASFRKIVGKALSYRTTTRHDGAVRKTEREIENTQNRITEITNEQRHQFQALSRDDQRKMCKVAGLEFLMRTYATVDEALPKADETKTSSKSEVLPGERNSEIGRQAEPEADKLKTSGCSEILPGEENTEIGRRAEPSAIEGKLVPQSDDQSKISHAGEKSPQVHEKQAGTQEGGAGTILIPHKRVKAPRGSAKPQTKAKPQSQTNSSQPLSRQGPLPPHIDDLESPALWLSAAQIEAALKWNRETQTVLVAELMKSKNDILQMQEDIREYEEKEGWIWPKVDVDIEQFLREREVVMSMGDEKNHQEVKPENEEG